jgi:thioredoxin reductase
LSFHTVVVIGAGPIGLLAAIEARQNFVKKVIVVEKRSSYTRTNVPTLQTEIRNEFKKLGVLKTMSNSAQVPFSQIEEALKEKAVNLGVKFELGYTVQSVVGLKKNKHGRYKSIHVTLKEWDEQQDQRPVWWI